MKKCLVIIGVVVLAIGSFLVGKYFEAPGRKIGYLDLNKVFSNFEMKKELELKMKAIQEQRNALLDSLKLDLKILARQIDENKDYKKLEYFEKKRELYVNQEEKFKEENLKNAKMFDEQIFTQINQYVKDFGIKKNYALIFGAEGSGTLMYAEETLNLTEELQSYINERYLGKTK